MSKRIRITSKTDREIPSLSGATRTSLSFVHVTGYTPLRERQEDGSMKYMRMKDLYPERDSDNRAIMIEEVQFLSTLVPVEQGKLLKVGQEVEADWSSTSNRVVFVFDDEGDYVMDEETGDPRTLVYHNAVNFRILTTLGNAPAEAKPKASAESLEDKKNKLKKLKKQKPTQESEEIPC